MAKIKDWRLVLIVLAGLLVGLELIGYGIEIFGWSRKPTGDADNTAATKTLKEFQSQNALLTGRLKALATRGVFIIIDTAENRLYVMNGEKVQKEVVVSCGSGDILEETGGTRKWIFDTPRGEFSVTSKLVNPTWIKPDWAFIEEGEKPPANFNERVDNDSLGSYALGFGNGFFIHGTLYTRLLGWNVTHGCVRAGDKDLEEVFRQVPMGAKIYIY
ncbi:MAG: L,D-transpeptidase [Candidatus Aminicenantes bacterium]|nr:L,D-transpeptidase [Candidatus Aminicenantes bacterium]